MGNKYNKYRWIPEQPRVYEASPLAISGTPMSDEDITASLKAENLQQKLQQNPIFKSAKQQVAQQEQIEKEIAASKKWLKLHPKDSNDDPYTIFKRGKHQAIVEGKDPSYYEKMIDEGKQFTKGALSVLSLPYLGAATAGAYGYGASLGARGLFAGQGIYGLANKDGIRKTANLIKNGDYGRAALSGAGDALNAAMILPGAKFLGNAAKYGLKSTVAGDMFRQGIRNAALTTSEPLLNIGWGPKQILKVSRAGEYDQMYFPKRWDVVNEGANPHGVWLQGKYGIPRTDATNPGKGMKAARARNVFSTRSDKYTGTVTLDKPMVTIGEVPNRSTLSYQADNIGADGLIYNGVYDNGYNNNQVILSFRKPKLTKIQLSEAERLGIPKSVRNQQYKPTTWLQGDDAIKMFNDYGGMNPIVDNSPLMERIVKYVPEARERYGLVGNTSISDETIAKALYKRAFQLNGNGNGAVNEYGEPLLLFRGDTQRYPILKPRMSPEELATKSGTMDNSLGTLFLDYPNHYQGLDRYIGTARYFNGEGELLNSGTGSKIIGGERPMQTPPVGSRLLYSGVWGRHKTPISVFKLPASEMESGVNDINAFVVRSPKVRDATSEISVLSDDFLTQGGPGKNYYGKSKIVYDENGFPEFLHSDGTKTPALVANENRLGMAEHYRYILNDAEAKQQGLLKSNKGSILRDEHTDYDYYALPNFNIRGTKHLLGYDLNYPLENSWSLYRKQGGILKRK